MPPHGPNRRRLRLPHAHPSHPSAYRGSGGEARDHSVESLDRGPDRLSGPLLCVSERRLLPRSHRCCGERGLRGRVRRASPGWSGIRRSLRDRAKRLGGRPRQCLRRRGHWTSRRASLAPISASHVAPMMWHTRAYRPEDLGSLAEFLAPLGDESFGSRLRGRVDAYYRWKYGNGAGESNRIRVAVGTNGLMGVVAMLPRRIKLGARILTVFELGDLLTDSRYRRQGVFSILAREACEASAAMGALSYVKPNARSGPILVNRLGFRRLVELDTLARPIRVSRILAHRFGRLTGVWTQPLDTLFAVCGSSGALLVTRETTFTEEFDGLWDAVAGEYPAIVVRDRAYLEWRYEENPTEYTILVARDASGRLQGFAVGLVVESEA